MRRNGLRGSRGLAGAAAGLLLVVTAAACTSSQKVAHENAACADTPGVTPSEVKVGLVLADTGPGSTSFAAARTGLDARLGLANAAGGVHGREIVYRLGDDGGSPARNTRVTADLVQQNVFGLLSITVALGDSLGGLEAQGIPVTGLAIAAWKRHSNLFSYAFETSPQTVARYIREAGGKKVGFLVTGAAASVLQATEPYRTALNAAGLTTTDTISYATGADSPAVVAQRLADSGADALLGFTSPQDFADIMQASRRQGLNLAASVSLSGYDRTLLPTLGKDLAGVSIPVYFRPFEAGGESLDRYRDAMSRFSPEAPQSEQEYAMYGYIFADMFVRGLELAGPCPTRGGFIDALRGESAYDGGGLLAPVDLGRNADQPLSCYAFVQVDPSGSAFQVARERLCAQDGG